MAEGTGLLKSSVRSLDTQPALPRDHFLVEDQPDAEAIPMDVVFVGGGPAGMKAAAAAGERHARRGRRRRGAPCRGACVPSLTCRCASASLANSMIWAVER